MDPPDSLLKIAKIVRSLQHLDALQKQVTSFFASDKHGLTVSFDNERRRVAVTAFSREEPPGEWSLLIGEVLYQLRSSLEHLACKVTEEDGGVVDRGVSFPIFLKRKDYRKEDGTLADAVERQVRGMSAEHQRLIELEQPFNRKDGSPATDPLWLLYILSDYDRHRDLHFARTVIIESGHEEFEPQWFAKRYFTRVRTNCGQAIDGELEVARYRISPKAYEVEPQVAVTAKSTATFTIAFEKGSPGAGLPVLPTLKAIGHRVALLSAPFYAFYA